MRKILTILGSLLIIYSLFVFFTANAVSKVERNIHPYNDVYFKSKVQVPDEPKTPVREAYSVNKSYLSIIREYDWDVNVAYAIMLCESNGNPNALNDNYYTGDYSIGLFQINMLGKMGENRRNYFGITNQDLYDPYINIKVAYQIYKSSGWNAWSCYRKI